MTTLHRFRTPLLDPTQDRPEGLRGAAGAPADTRYDVYRNNVTHSLIGALHSAFPLVVKILGTQNFDQIAPAFVRAHPPSSPLMMHYGADFPQFLAAQPALSKMGYLPDCARLDLALRRSYHAADSAPFDLAAFQQIAPDAMMQAQLPPAPATVLLRSGGCPQAANAGAGRVDHPSRLRPRPASVAPRRRRMVRRLGWGCHA